uniref:Putative secreted protein n=1 Tax=Anopheles triannulatus TaxID=58253 RepID=A0A2M4B4R6_9DIPT
MDAILLWSFGRLWWCGLWLWLHRFRIVEAGRGWFEGDLGHESTASGGTIHYRSATIHRNDRATLRRKWWRPSARFRSLAYLYRFRRFGMASVASEIQGWWRWWCHTERFIAERIIKVVQRLQAKVELLVVDHDDRGRLRTGSTIHGGRDGNDVVVQRKLGHSVRHRLLRWLVFDSERARIVLERRDVNAAHAIGVAGKDRRWLAAFRLIALRERRG